MATTFDLGGLLGMGGSMFGGGPSALDEFLTPEQRAAIQQQAGLSAAAALLQAGGPSTTRTSLGQALGSAFTAGQTGYQTAQKTALSDILARQKLGEAKTEADVKRTATEYLSRPVPEGIDPAQFKSQQYMKLADIYAVSKPEQASKYFDMAQKLIPKVEVVGQPFEAVDESGKPVMVQQYKDGTIQTLPGFGPKREVTFQNLGGKVIAVDKSKLTGGEVFDVTMSPAEAARLKIDEEQLNIAKKRLGLSQAEFNRGQYERVDTAQGIMYVPKAPGFPPIPITGPDGTPLLAAGGKPSEGEANAAGFAQRMERVDDIISRLPPSAAPGAGSAMVGAIPFVGGVAQRGVQSAQTQQYQQAANDWIRAKLRKESGAAIGVDEMKKEYETYFPQVGDTPEVIAQKTTARQVATAGMKRSAGKAYQPYTPEEPAPAAAAAPQVPAAAKEGAVSTTRSGEPIVFRNGRWMYQ